MVRDYILRSSVSPVFPLHIMQPQVTATFITNQCGSEAKYKKINFTVMYIQHVYNTSPRSGCYNNHCTSSPVISKLNVLEATHTFTDTNKRKTKVGWGSLLQGKKKKEEENTNPSKKHASHARVSSAAHPSKKLCIMSCSLTPAPMASAWHEASKAGSGLALFTFLFSFLLMRESSFLFGTRGKRKKHSSPLGAGFEQMFHGLG